MAAYDLQEQEQIEEIKTWWKQHGNALINACLVVLICIVGWRAWQWYQEKQSLEASSAYTSLQSAIQGQDMARVQAANGELIEKFGRSNYAVLGALTSAKVMVTKDDAKTARLQLAWAAEHAKDEWREIARLRLATLLIDEKAYDEALRALEGSMNPAFEARFHDLRGDVFNAQGKKADALKAYRAAFAKVEAEIQSFQVQGRAADPHLTYREVIRLKLDALGDMPS